MVGQERKHPALIWREYVDLAPVAALGPQVRACWELVHDQEDFFFAVQYATIYKHGKRKWELRYFNGPHEIITYHKTLTEAKALGIVNVRFNQAQLTN